MSFDFLDGIRTNGQRNPKSIIEQKHHTAKEINIVVLGMRGTGKTALTVRFLTKRFIGDYDSEVASVPDFMCAFSDPDVNLGTVLSFVPVYIISGVPEMLYSHTTTIEGKHITLHILDTVGQGSKDDVSKEQVLWADGVFLVYAINDKRSFDVVKSILEDVQQTKGDDHITVALIANKCDLMDRKQVPDTDVSRLCTEYSDILFFETSASENHSSVVEAFTMTSRQIRLINKKREKLTRFMSNPAVAAKLQIQQSWKTLEKSWRARTSTL